MIGIFLMFSDTERNVIIGECIYSFILFKMTIRNNTLIQ